MWEVEPLELWRSYGCVTCEAYLERELGYSPRTARERRRVARALASLPATFAALGANAIHYSAARELTRVVTPTTENQWLVATVGKTLREVERLVVGHSPGDLPDDPPKPSTEMRTVRYDVSPSTYALLRQARKVLQDECDQGLDDDAFLEALCRRALQPPGDDPPPASHQIAVTTCDTCKRAWQDGGGITIEIPPAATSRAKCDAVRIGRLDAEKPERAKTDISPATRRLVWRRDHGRCLVPGCRSTRFLELHHVVFREHGGSNAPSNLMLCCAGHHAAIHDGFLRVTGVAPDRLQFSAEQQKEAG